MKPLNVARIALVVVAFSAVGCDMNRASEELDAVSQATMDSPLAKPAPSERADLGVCKTDNVLVKETTPQAAERTAAQARGAAPHVVRTLHGAVTIGAVFETEPKTRGDVMRDDRGLPVEGRSAYVLVRDGISDPVGGGGTLVPEGQELTAKVPQRSRSTVTAQAWVIDAKTGEMLFGWSCATRVERPDGTVIEVRGADSDYAQRTVS